MAHLLVSLDAPRIKNWRIVFGNPECSYCLNMYNSDIVVNVAKFMSHCMTPFIDISNDADAVYLMVLIRPVCLSQSVYFVLLTCLYKRSFFIHNVFFLFLLHFSLVEGNPFPHPQIKLSSVLASSSIQQHTIYCLVLYILNFYWILFWNTNVVSPVPCVHPDLVIFSIGCVSLNMI